MRFSYHKLRRIAAVGSAAGAIIFSSMAWGQSNSGFDFNVAPQSLGASLRDVAKQSGLELVINAKLIRGRLAPPLKGHFTTEAALNALLNGSGLVAEISDGTVFIRGRSEPPVTASASVPDANSDILVTGSRIRGVVPAGSHVIALDRTDIDKSGYATTQQILQSLPQSYGGGANESTFAVSQMNGASAGGWGGSSINLRGLGASSTLVLIGGHRMPSGGYGTFTDVSLIPSSAIDRIEILADGASAVYGSDAIAGVVNVALRDKFKGAESRIRFGSADGDFSDIQAGQLFGTTWSTGHAVLAYEYYSRGRLPASDRPFATEDLRGFGGADYRSNYANPGTIIAGGKPFGIPAGQDGTDLQPGQLVANQTNRRDIRLGSDIIPRQARHSVYFSIAQSALPDLDLYASALFARRSFNLRYTQADTLSSVTVPTSNPFYVDPVGMGKPVSVRYSFIDDLGQPTRRGIVQSYTANAGARLTIGAWNAETSLTYGLETDRQTTGNVPNLFRLNLALADTNPATAYNLFGDGSHTNPDTISKVRGFYSYRTRNRYLSSTTKADGPLLALPGGEVRLAFGSEYREELLTSTEFVDRSTPAPVFSRRSDFPGTRKVLAGYGELYIPLFTGENARAGLQRLELSLAGRIEHYNDFGTTANPRVGVSWEPVSGLRLRGSYGRSFRAPSPPEVAQGPIFRAYLPYPLPDPASPTGTTNALLILGNDPQMGPERATTWTAGFELHPSAIAGLSFSASYFSVNYRDRITDVTGNVLNFLAQRSIYSGIINSTPTAADIAAIYSAPEFQNPFGIQAENIGVIINSQRQNLASVKQSGVDADLGYTFSIAAGQATIGVDGTYLFQIKQAVTAAAPYRDVVGTVGNPVDLRLRGKASWSAGPVTFSTVANFTNGYKNTLLAAPAKVHSWTTIDMQIGYQVPEGSSVVGGMRFSLSATNLFDRDPPYVEYANGVSAIGYDPENASAIGRVISLQVIKQW